MMDVLKRKTFENNEIKKLLFREVEELINFHDSLEYNSYDATDPESTYLVCEIGTEYLSLNIKFNLNKEQYDKIEKLDYNKPINYDTKGFIEIITDNEPLYTPIDKSVWDNIKNNNDLIYNCIKYKTYKKLEKKVFNINDHVLEYYKTCQLENIPFNREVFDKSKITFYRVKSFTLVEFKTLEEVEKIEGYKTYIKNTIPCFLIDRESKDNNHYYSLELYCYYTENNNYNKLVHEYICKINNLI